MKNKKVFFLITLVLLIAGLVVGVILVKQNQESRRQAADVDCEFKCIGISAVGIEGNLDELEPQEVCFQLTGWTNCSQGLSGAEILVDGQSLPASLVRQEGQNYYYQQCYDFTDVTSSCYVVSGKVCVDGVCR